MSDYLLKVTCKFKSKNDGELQKSLNKSLVKIFGTDIKKESSFLDDYQKIELFSKIQNFQKTC